MATSRRKQQVTKTKTRPVAKQNDPVEVPFQQTLISSSVIAIAVGCLSLAFGWDYKPSLLAFGLSLALIWFWRLKLFDGLLFAIETVTQQDLDHDGSVGKPVRNVVVNGTRARAAVSQTVKQQEQESARDALIRFISLCYTLGTSESAQGIKPSDRSQYLEHRDTLMRLGVAAWKSSNPKAGWRMVVDQGTALRMVAEHVTEV